MSTLAAKEPQRPAISFYLSDPSISTKEAEAMSKAYDDACRLLELSGRKFSPRAVAVLIDNFAYDGEHNASRLLKAVLAAHSSKNC